MTNWRWRKAREDKNDSWVSGLSSGVLGGAEMGKT